LQGDHLSSNTQHTLEEWSGFQDLNLTLLFTDIVDSTALGKRLGDRVWVEDLFRHFSTAREYAGEFDCHVVKVIGDSLMVAFRTSTDAVDFALNFAFNTGVEHIGIRIGINSGQVHIRENDIYGLNVNFTSRLQHALLKQGVLVSNSVKRDYEKTFGAASSVSFHERTVDLKSFGSEIVFAVTFPGLRDAFVQQNRKKASILFPATGK
jgi:class 3 adenylate cyclase